MHVIRKAGNASAHDSKPVPPEQAERIVRHLFDVLVRVAKRFSTKPLPPAAPFDVAILRAAPKQAAQSRQQLLALQRELDRLAAESDGFRLQLSEAEAAQLALERELAEQAREKAAAQETADDALREAREARERVKHLEAELRERYLEQQEAVRASEEASAVDLPPLARSEADTRRDIIDPMLADAGFSVAGGNLTVEYPIEDLYIDYVAWGTDGQPLAIIEAKKTERSINDGRVQAEDYAEALGRKFGRVPLVFYTNGHDVRFWDRDAELPGGYCYEARQVEEYPTAAAMEELIRRRGKRQPLETTEISDITARPYQQQMLRAVSERFAAGHRRALLVMATGTGKTRVSISLVKMLMEAGWVRNVLFLADR